MTAPSVLLLDDGALPAIQAILERLRVDWVRPETGGAAVQRPRDLIISSGPCTMAMPPLAGEASPLWICLYDRDFLPLREALAGLGVHYLVSTDLAARALELFIRQLLHGDDERRGVRRIPLACEVRVDVGAERRKAQLIELSTEACVLAADSEIPAERRVVVWLPAETLTGAEELEVPGQIVRASGSGGDSAESGVVHVFRFGALDAETMAGVQRMLLGETLEAEVTPLREEPARKRRAPPTSAAEPDTIELVEEVSGGANGRPAERRGASRRPYARSVGTLRWQGGETPPELALARDLSTTGVRVTTSARPTHGSVVTLALHGGSREEPVLVQARVVRSDGEEVGLRFESLEPAQRNELQRLVDGGSRVERLGGGGGSLCVAELLSD